MLGLCSISLRSSKMILRGSLDFTLSLTFPSPTLTIFAINVFLEQTATLALFAPGADGAATGSQQRRGKRHFILRGGSERTWWEAGYEKDAREGGKTLLDSEMTERKAGAMRWDWEGTALLVRLVFSLDRPLIPSADLNTSARTLVSSAARPRSDTRDPNPALPPLLPPSTATLWPTPIPRPTRLSASARTSSSRSWPRPLRADP